MSSSARPSVGSAPATSGSMSGSTPGPDNSNSTSTKTAAHSANAPPRTHLSIADEKKYRKKYAELASKLRALEKDNDELVTRYETVKHLLLRLKAEKKILVDVLDKIYEQEDHAANPIPPLQKDDFTVHALPITTDRHLIDKALIAPPAKHQALGLVAKPAPSTGGSDDTPAAANNDPGSSSAPQAAKPPTSPGQQPKADRMEVDHQPDAIAITSNRAPSTSTKVAGNGIRNKGEVVAADADTPTDLQCQDAIQLPPPAKRPRLAGPSSERPLPQQPPSSAASAPPMRKIGSVASLLDDPVPSASSSAPPTSSAGNHTSLRPSASPRMRPTVSHHGYPPALPSSSSGSSVSYPQAYGSVPPPISTHHHHHHHHPAYADYPSLHSPTSPTNPAPSGSSVSNAPGNSSNAFSSRASSTSQLSGINGPASMSAYPPPAPPGAYAPSGAQASGPSSSSVPPPMASRPGPEYFEPAPYRTGGGAPTSPSAYEYHHHHHLPPPPPPASSHYAHHHVPPPPHRPPPPPAYGYHHPQAGYYDYPPPQQQQQQQQAQVPPPPHYGSQGHYASSAGAKARSPPSANGTGPQ